MGSLSDYSELELLDHVFNVAYSPVTTVYLGLSTADPGEDASGNAEPSGNGYVRKAVTFGAASGRAIANSASVDFDQASGAWGTISDWGLWDAESGGNMLAYGGFTVSKAIVDGNTPSVAIGEIDVSINAGTTTSMSTVLAHKLLDLMFRNTAYAVPDTYVALTTAAVVDADTGSSITEVSGNSYARKQVNVNGGSSPTWDIAASNVVDNTHDIVFATPTGTWGLVTAMCICSALTAGDMLFYYNDVTEQTPNTGDTVQFLAGTLDVSLT